MSENLITIPHGEINEKIIPAEFLFDAWHEASSAIFDTKPLRKTTEIKVCSQSYLLDRLFFTKVRWNDIQYSRSQSYLKQGDTDYILMQIYFLGTMQGVINDNLLKINPTDIIFQDLAHEYIGITGECDNMGVVIPRELIKAENQIYSLKKPISVDVKSAPGQILLNTMMTTWELLPSTTIKEAPAIANGLIGLVNGLFGFNVDDTDIHYQKKATFKAIKKYISNNLTSTKLSRDHICKYFNISNSTLTRFFQKEGGLHNFITTQKLRHCFDELVKSKPEKITINTIIVKYGFYDHSHFNKIFKKHFNCSPSDVLGMEFKESESKNTMIPDDNHNKIKTWLKNL